MNMKFKMIKLVIILFLLIVVMPMILPGPNGKPMMTIDDWIPDVDAIADTVSVKVNKLLYVADDIIGGNSGGESAIRGPKLYKWQDESGAWHFSDAPHESATKQTAQAMPSIKNSMQAPPQIDFGGSNSSSEASVGGGRSIPLPLTISPDKIGQLISDAKNVQKLADDRVKKLNQIR